MFCTNCGKEVAAEEKLCKGYGTRVENMCPECGCSLEEGARFCGHCGYGMGGPVHEPILSEAERRPESDGFLKVQKLTGILYLIAVGLLILIGLADIDYAWGDVALCCGIGVLGLAAKTTFNWDVISIFMGMALLVPGILILLKKSWKTVFIVEIVLGSFVLLLGLADSGYDWGITALIDGVLFLATGIIWLVNLKKLYVPESNEGR